MPEANLLIGKRHDQAFFKGTVDEVMILSKALSLEDIKSIMEQGLDVENVDRLSVTWGSLKGVCKLSWKYTPLHRWRTVMQRRG